MGRRVRGPGKRGAHVHQRGAGRVNSGAAFITITAFALVAMGYDVTESLFMSQVVLSIALPVPMIALVMLTHRANIMGEFINSRLVNVAAWTATLVG
jgi:Mn2+/Fe2+ NRAMP family transporter